MHSLELWRNFICGNETGSPGRAASLHLARSGSQSEHRIRRILPARGACHVIRGIIIIFHIGFQIGVVKGNVEHSLGMRINGSKGVTSKCEARYSIRFFIHKVIRKLSIFMFLSFQKLAIFLAKKNNPPSAPRHFSKQDSILFCNII